MNAQAPRICAITPGHVASAPRVVKEANALVEAGYRVHVICGRSFPPADPFDAKIFAESRWERTQVDFLRVGATVRKVLHRVARAVLTRRPLASVRLAARAHHAEALRLYAAAARVPAAIYIGHCLAGLPAAALAARATGAKYGFDAEDLHDEETHRAIANPGERAASRQLQTQLLPGCAHLTVSAPLIGAEMERRYQVAPTVTLNVFPLADAPLQPIDPGPISVARPAVFYWFSQTIGPGRGLEGIIDILARMQTPLELHLRGFPAGGYCTHLQALAARNKLPPIKFLAPGAAAEMVRLAATADIGVATEETEPLNRDLCLTNKIFVYLLAGIPQLLSPTSAQSALAAELGSAALMIDRQSPTDTARRLDALLTNPARIARARAHAWRLARERFNWDREKHLMVDSIRNALAPHNAGDPSRFRS